jgi:hypothetical protein
MKKVEGLVIVGCLLMFVLSTVAVAANSNDSEFRYETKTIILNNVSNSFPMFSDAEYVNFTIGDNTINLTLDLMAYVTLLTSRAQISLRLVHLPN